MQESLLEKQLYTKAAQNKIPISGTFELLPVCNLDCKMCYVKKSMSEVKQLGGLKSADEWIALGRRAADSGMLFLLLTGGEPFLFPDFEKLYLSLHQMGLSIDINSNGTLITEEQIAYLSKYRPRHVKISLYGSSRESYEALCGDGKAFDKVIDTFDRLKKAGVIVYSSITVTPHNHLELQEMMNICESYRIPVKATAYMFPPHRSNMMHINEEYRLSSYDAAKAALEIVKSQNDKQLFLDKAKEYSDDYYQEYFKTACQNQECGRMECRGGTCTFWVTWDGHMIPCAMMDFEKYPVMGDNDFNKAWANINNLVDQIMTPAECATCPARKSCYTCAASSLCETGATWKRSEYVCEVTSHYMKLMKEEYLKHADRF